MLPVREMIANVMLTASLAAGSLGMAVAPPLLPTAPASAPRVHIASFDRIVGPARICGQGATGLIAGQSINVGRVLYANNNTSLFVGYRTTGDWYIKEVHLELVADPHDFPVNGGGNPQIGHFRFADTFDPPTQEVVFQFSLNDLGFEPGQRIYIAAHAVVCRIEGNRIVQEETAWGRGYRFGGGSWAMFDDFRLGLCR